MCSSDLILDISWFVIGFVSRDLLRWLSTRWQRSRPLILVPGGKEHARGDGACGACWEKPHALKRCPCGGYIHNDVTGGIHDDPCGWEIKQCDRCGQTWEESPNV